MAVSVLMVRALLQACTARGIDRSDLLREGESDVELALTDIHLRLAGDDFERVCQRALALTGDPALGLCLGAELPEHALQVVGYLVRSATSLRAAHTDFARFSSLLAETPVWQLAESETNARFEFRCPVPHPLTMRMANEWAMALAYRCIRAFSPSPAYLPTRVEFSHPRPAHAARYAAVFQCDVRFNCKTNAVVYPRALLDLPQLHGDAVVSAALRDTAERLLDSAHAATGQADRVRMLLKREPELLTDGVASIARRLSISESTLRRALALEGASPSSLIDEARCQNACAALTQHERSVKSVAHALGYADTRSFHRAFKRWTGVTPVVYRAQRLTDRNNPSVCAAHPPAR